MFGSFKNIVQANKNVTLRTLHAHMEVANMAIIVCNIFFRFLLLPSPKPILATKSMNSLARVIIWTVFLQCTMFLMRVEISFVWQLDTCNQTLWYFFESFLIRCFVKTLLVEAFNYWKFWFWVWFLEDYHLLKLWWLDYHVKTKVRLQIVLKI